MLQRNDQRIVQLLGAQDVFSAELQQWPDTVADLFVVGQQISELALLVQSRPVIADSVVEQQAGHPVLHLHHLSDHQVSVAQHTSPITDLGEHMWHSGSRS